MKFFKRYLVSALLTLATLNVNTQAAQSIFTDPSAGSCTDLAPSNTGAGACTIASVSAFNVSENITFTATSSGPTATFSVVGSVSGSLGTVTSGGIVAFTDPYGFPRFSVTLSDSGANYIVGDNFRVTLTAGSELKKANFDLFDLTQVCSNGCSAGAALTAATSITAPSFVYTAEAGLNYSRDAAGSSNLTSADSTRTRQSVTNSTSTGNAVLNLNTASGSSGDNYIEFNQSGDASNWHIGRDDSNSGFLVFSYDAAALASSTPFLKLGTTGIGAFLQNVMVGGNTTDIDSTNTYLKIGTSAASTNLSGTTQEGIQVSLTSSSASTASTVGLHTFVRTANSAYTTAYRAQIFAQDPSKGAASTITRDIILLMDPATQGGTGNASIADNILFSGSYFINSTDTNPTLVSGDVKINTAGKGYFVKEGSNAKMGTCTLVGGTCTVSTTAVASTSRVFLTSQVDGGTPGFLRVSTRSAATSFTVTSSSGTDTSTVAWIIFDPS